MPSEDEIAYIESLVAQWDVRPIHIFAETVPPEVWEKVREAIVMAVSTRRLALAEAKRSEAEVEIAAATAISATAKAEA